MRDPRIDPIEGDVVERNGVTRTVMELFRVDANSFPWQFRVCFRHQKRGREEEETCGALSLDEWRDRTAGATILKRGDDPRDVTQADRDSLREAIWEAIRERTRYWVDRDRQIHDVLLGMACDVRYAIEAENAE